MISTFICPKCSAKVTKHDTDEPGCPCCGLNKHEHANGPVSNKTQACTVCESANCTQHLLLG